ncbi:hypothetical protein FIBSPDRAFT_941811 [Athelia psychrophila]|uniref:Uncharacterized protein n=1 Tax=Athelia psychrophila TaxID=1759441 RepID=A0A167TEB4_9AGAM|nr:hypothetical protein FIBSPDRAFT_941811 [Fibularhizoctonia sp. CBS 109695]
MPKRISTFEVIEDSEPEREERRRQGIGEGMASIKKRTGENAINAKTATSVLELSDDSYAGRPRVISTPIISNPMLVDTNSIVDISDDEVPTRNDQQQNPTVNGDVLKHNAVSASTAPKVPPFSSFRDNALAISSDSEHDREEEDRMKLGHFAYLNPSRSNSRAALSRSNSIPATDKKLLEPAPKNKPARAKPQHRFTTDFTELELTRLVKCISCDIRWTTRKGVAQKMTHIQSCAKKNALTDDTVKTLIRKDVDKVIAETPTVPNPAKKGKGKGVEDAAPSAPKTILEEVVEGTETKRKGRRVEVVETVKDALEIRGVILDRARTVLGERVLQNTQEGLNRQPLDCILYVWGVDVDVE